MSASGNHGDDAIGEAVIAASPDHSDDDGDVDNGHGIACLWPHHPHCPPSQSSRQRIVLNDIING